MVASPAPRLFVMKAVTAWAIPQLRGVDGKRSTDMIILPSEFYDLNSWDMDGRPESTRREWRRKVNGVLDDMCKEAIAAAEEILSAEGVLLEIAA